jgi:hypothetical protein
MSVKGIALQLIFAGRGFNSPVGDTVPRSNHHEAVVISRGKPGCAGLAAAVDQFKPESAGSIAGTPPYVWRVIWWAIDTLMPGGVSIRKGVKAQAYLR